MGNVGKDAGGSGEAAKRFVYFIRCTSTGLTKIGIATDPLARLKALQLGSAVPLTMLGTVPGGRSEEVALHRQFASKRISREWFDLSDEDIAEALASGGAEMGDTPFGADFVTDDDGEGPWVASDWTGIPFFSAVDDGLSMLNQRGRVYLQIDAVIRWHEANRGGESRWDGETLEAARRMLAKLRRGDYQEAR